MSTGELGRGGREEMGEDKVRGWVWLILASGHHCLPFLISLHVYVRTLCPPLVWLVWLQFFILDMIVGKATRNPMSALFRTLDLQIESTTLP